MYESVEYTLGGFGVGVVSNVVFAAAEGNINAHFNPVVGNLVLIMSAIFFGIGLIHGRGKDAKEHGSES
jgi:hypothetical protein